MLRVGARTQPVYSILDWEGFRARSIKPDSPGHVLVEGHDHSQKLRGISYPSEKSKQFISADKVKGLGQVDVGQV